MEASRKPRWHFRAGLLGGLLLAVLGVACGTLRFGESLARLSYDVPFRFRNSAPFTEIVLVYIDESAIERYSAKGAYVMDRAVQTRLLRKLTAERATLVLYDFIFDTDSADPRVDQEFARAMSGHGAVVLGAAYEEIRENNIEQRRILAPNPVLRSAAKGWGLLYVQPDNRDNVVRQIYPGTADEPNAVWVAAKILNAPVAQEPARRLEERWLNYYGPPAAPTNRPPILPGCRFESALEPNGVPEGYFRNKIVFVCPRSAAGVGSESGGGFRTPYSRGNDLNADGAQIHATALLNLLRNEWLTRLPTGWQVLLLVVIGFGAGLLLSALRPWHAVWVAGLSVLLIATFTFHLQWSQRVWWSWMVPVAVQVPLALVWSVGVHYVLETRRRLRLRRAFSAYVSPHIADQIAESNFDLAPGGKVVEATIMFTDLEGFTTISESLETHEVSSLLTAYFNQTTRTILERKGTITKFIGDAVMALWGAPLADPHQAENAVVAALEMVEAGRKQISGRRLRTRVGINSGSTLAGNLGSDVRFDYTAIGDAVNSASRLEGLNKHLGTEILISDATRRQLSERIRTRYLGRFLVMGKFEPLTIYEVLGFADGGVDQTGWIAEFDQALAAFRAREFERAEKLFRRVIELRGGSDGPSAFYLEQIALAAKTLRPQDSWDGVVLLGSK